MDSMSSEAQGRSARSVKSAFDIVPTGRSIGAEIRRADLRALGPDEVLASRTVRDLSAGSGLRFESLGAQRLKGLAEETEVYRVSKPVGVPL